MMVYKILTSAEHADLERLRSIPGSPADIADGFVHLSTAAQLQGTAAKHFSGQSGLWLLALDADRLGDSLEWEPSRGGDLFPHLYRSLVAEDVVWARPFPLGADGRHLVPEDLR